MGLNKLNGAQWGSMGLNKKSDDARKYLELNRFR
jgi:hypothetical protein